MIMSVQFIGKYFMLFQNLDELIFQLKNKGYESKVLDLLPPGFTQKGQTCKLNALSAGLHYRYQSDPTSNPLPPYPTKFNIRRNHFVSSHHKFNALRQQAKQLGSVTGEIYDVRDLIDLARTNGFKGVYAKHYDSKESYSEALITAINLQQAINVFYDTDPNTGQAIRTNSENEHGAMVVGYALMPDEPTLVILSSWNQYVALSVDELYQSTIQLQPKRRPEAFIKFAGKFWQNLPQDSSEIQSAEYRQAKAPSEDAISLRGAILYISDPIDIQKEKTLYNNHGFEQIAFTSESASRLTDFPSEAKQFTNDTGLTLSEHSPKRYSEKRIELNKPKYIPLDVLIHFLEIANSFQNKISLESLQEFAEYFELNDQIRRLCLIDNQTELSGSLMDDIYRQNPDSRRSIVELISNAMDAQAEKIIVDIEDGYYQVTDNGCGMTADILFNKLFIPKSSSKLVVTDSIGRFGVGFYTALSHLKDDTSSVVIKTHSLKEHYGYQINFRYRNGFIEVNIETHEDIPLGTTITVADSLIKTTNYVNYAKNFFVTYRGDGLIINGEAIKIADSYKTYTIPTASALIARTDESDPSIKITISNVLISEITLPRKSHALTVIWCLPKDTTITESRDAVQIDSLELVQTIKNLINVVYDLPGAEKVPYLNMVSVAISELQNRNPYGADNNLQLYLMYVLSNIVGSSLIVPDGRQFDFLVMDDCVRVHQNIIPENWIESLGFKPQEWHSHHVITFVVKGMSKGKHIYFDDINKTLYITEALYLCAKKTPSQMAKVTKILLRDNIGSWQFSTSQSLHSRARAADLYNFSEYSPPPYHALYMQHGGLTHVTTSVLDNITQENREILRVAQTLVAKYPFKGNLKKDFLENKFDTLGYYRTFKYEEVSYFVNLDNTNKWRTVIYDEHFQPVSGKHAELILALFRDSTEVILPKVAKVDKVILRKGDCTQLVSLETKAILLDNLPLHSYYQAIPDSDYYIIREKDAVPHNRATTNYIYDNKNLCIKKYQGNAVNVIPWRDFYLIFCYGESADSYTTVDLYDKNFYVLSSTRIFDYYGYALPDSIKSFQFNDETYIVIKSPFKAAVLTLTGDELKQSRRAILVGNSLSYIIIDEQLYQLAKDNIKNYGRVKTFKYDDHLYSLKEYMGIITSTFVVYETDTAQVNLLTPAGQHWKLPDNIDYQKFTNCYSNHFWLAIKQNDGRHLLLKKGVFANLKDKLLLCEKVTLIESSLESFALVDGRRLLNAKGVQVFYHTEEMEVDSHPACPYLILVTNIIEFLGRTKRDYFILDSDGHLLFPTSLKYAFFAKNQSNWRIVAGIDDTQFNLTANGIISNQGKTLSCFENNFPYLFYPEQADYFHPEAITKITTNTYLVPTIIEKKWRWEKFASLPYFYKQLSDQLLNDKDVLANLNYLNQRDLSVDAYSNALRFVDCSHEIFVTFYPIQSLLTYTPTRQQFYVYYKFYNLIISQNRAFIKKAIQLIDLIYFAAGKNADIDLNSKIIDIANLYGVSVLSQLYDVYSRKYLELYRVLSIDNEIDNFLAPFPKKLRELSYYLFSQQTSMFNEKSFKLLSDNNDFSRYCSLLDVITVASLRIQDIAQLQSPEELFLLLSAFGEKIDRELARRKLIHATYHLCDVSAPNYLREMIQNAMDASAKGVAIKIELYQTPSGRHVTRVIDQGCGMDLYTVLHSLVIPGNSTKRGNEEFIGGRGIGFFSTFHGAESVTLKTSKGNGITHYFNLIPVYDENNVRIIDVQLSGQSCREDFVGTTIERVSRADNGFLEAAKTLTAARQYGRFIDAGQYKILLNESQINASLDYIGKINIDSLGLCKIYTNAECAFTAGGLFIKNIDEEYWDGIPDFIANRLKTLGIVIELPSSIALTRERNNFYAADKFKNFFKPSFFQLCLNAYCNLLKQGKIEANYLPDDLFRRLKAVYINSIALEEEILADAKKVNDGQLFDSYNRYLSHINCVFLLTHIEFINYGNTLVSLADISKLNQTSNLNTQKLPDFVSRRIEAEIWTIKCDATYEKKLSNPKNVLERKLTEHKYSIWYMNNEEVLKNAPNWALFYKLCTKLTALVADKYDLELTIRFSTLRPAALASVMCEELNKIVKNGKSIKQGNISFNPFNWEEKLTSLFESRKPSISSISNFINELMDTLSHEIAHVDEESLCGTNVKSITHIESFRALNANIFADMMLALDTDELIKQVMAEIESIYKSSNNKPSLPNAKEFMIMQLYGMPDYLEYLKSEKDEEALSSPNRLN